MNRPVVVGVDGSPPSLVAAEHAARAAVQRSRPLHLVHGYLHPLGYGVPVNPYDLGLPAPTEDGQKMLEQAAADLAERWPGLTVEVRQVAGGPGATLVEESRRAELVVVGSRGLGGFAGLLLGSVGTQVASHAHCPVLVVRPAEEPIPVAGPVLVGVDGSEPAELAVGYAADEATRRGTGLVLAHVRPPDGERRVPDEVTETGSAAHAESAGLLATAAAAVRGSHPGLPVEERVLSAAKPEQALIEASGDAALVVVGSRGRGGFAGLLLGSVSQALVQHAHCPVLVARPYGHAR
ncbi:Nucleotide-binding universal stress protein, UspA family [Micromonospora citrea]|uniref:Nucleotide-binding universal stress protein, UspA family n=1 Tax=Micromonospora citrea TaxID=47855 RepID=A0A1C6TXK7_9ACTN|nr:universal stress protein [Micromonospora citrea]SCL46494.1 Nucleotide-binding universal stress protein, UspA family [Micromonospora citrea]